MDWRQEYRRKLVSPQEAARLVKSGSRILIPPASEAIALERALADRKGELTDVVITHGGPQEECDWYSIEGKGSFSFEIQYVRGPARAMMDERNCDFAPFAYSLQFKSARDKRRGARRWDFLFVPVSPPDKEGFCSFGHALWYKKSALECADTVVAEVDASLIRTHGDNRVRVSEIDYFVEHTSPPPQPLFEYQPKDFSRPISEYVSSLVNDGDTIQIGAGEATILLGKLGTFDHRQDLGLHSEVTFLGLRELMEKGVFTGKRKTLNPGKMVASTIWVEEGILDFVQDNPMFELRDLSYVCDPKVIAAHDNMISVQSALAVDLTGQIAVISIGPRIWSGTGGHFDFAIGSLLSKGGRFVEALPSTARGGTISRIVPQLEPGTIVTVPRDLADHVVTEYGIASLMGKTVRERSQELIAVAHPDFRAELRRQADRLFWP